MEVDAAISMLLPEDKHKENLILHFASPPSREPWWQWAVERRHCSFTNVCTGNSGEVFVLTPVSQLGSDDTCHGDEVHPLVGIVFLARLKKQLQSGFPEWLNRIKNTTAPP